LKTAFADYVPLVEVTRGGVVESIHHGAVAVVDAHGQLLYSAGDPNVEIFTRSACKPFQAMPFVAQGGPQKFGFTLPEIAIMCASHSGEPRHEQTVRGMLSKIGLSEADLQCGTHPPVYYNYLGQLAREGEVFTPAQHNCSGKHTGMMAFCLLTGTPHKNYLDPDHPIQRQIKKSVSHFAGVPEQNISMGTDGCSAPNFALPLIGLARAFAQLAVDEPDDVYGDAPRTIFKAMTTHPEMVSGERRNDLAIMQTGAGDWVSKVGAEAMQGVGIRSQGLGIAIKIADGNPRALHPITVEVLRQIGVLDNPESTPLAPFARPEIKNYRNTITGEIRPAFTLKEHVRAAAFAKGAS
jgi:L-asparaginase II